MPSPTRIVTARLDAKLAAELDALASTMRRSRTFLINEAVAHYLAVNAWQVRAIKEAMHDVGNGEVGISHEEMVASIEAWDTPDELPPEPK